MQPKLQQTNEQKNLLGALQTGEAYLMQHAHGALIAKSAKQPCQAFASLLPAADSLARLCQHS